MTATHYRHGTHRSCAPEETRDRVEPLLRDYGITRVADVTGLDTLGVPVVQAVRPASRTLSVSQGKGLTKPAATVSAVMESIELWHVENLEPDRDLDATFDEVGHELDAFAGGAVATSRLTSDEPVSWLRATELATGCETMVPFDFVAMDWTPEAWPMKVAHAHSNGLASGNRVDEATLHALYELVERDSIAQVRRCPPELRTRLDLSSLTDATCHDLVAGLADRGVWVEVLAAPNAFDVPCFVAYVWNNEYEGMLGSGQGAHADASIALSRAITEAAQSRLTVIAGARDDISASSYVPDGFAPPATIPYAHVASWEALGRAGQEATDSFEAELQWLTAKLTTELGASPVVVDVGTCDDLRVVKAFQSCLAFDARSGVPRERRWGA